MMRITWLYVCLIGCLAASWGVVAGVNVNDAAHATPADPRATTEHTSTSDPIPNVVHFVYGLRDPSPVLSLLHELAVRAASRYIRPTRIYFHYYYMPVGPHWDAIRPLLHLKPLPALPQSVFGRELRHYAHRADVVRLEVLLAYGGIYLDLDVVALRSFDDLLHGGHEAIMGGEGENSRIGLCNAVILAKKNATFVQHWYNAYRSFDGTDWNYHSVVLPKRLALRYPSLIHALPHTAFFWPLWDHKGLRDLFLGRRKDQFHASYAVHLWETAANKVFLQETPHMYTIRELIETVDSNAFCHLRPLLPPNTATHPHHHDNDDDGDGGEAAAMGGHSHRHNPPALATTTDAARSTDDETFDADCLGQKATRPDHLIAQWLFMEPTRGDRGCKLVDGSGSAAHGYLNPLTGFTRHPAQRLRPAPDGSGVGSTARVYGVGFDGVRQHAFLTVPSGVRSARLTFSAWYALPEGMWSSDARAVGTAFTLQTDRAWIMVQRSRDAAGYVHWKGIPTTSRKGSPGLFTGLGSLFFNSGADDEDGAWHHIAVTADKPSGRLLIYIDGVLRSVRNWHDDSLLKGIWVGMRPPENFLKIKWGGASNLRFNMAHVSLFEKALGPRAIHAIYEKGPAVSPGTKGVDVPTSLPSLLQQDQSQWELGQSNKAGAPGSDVLFELDATSVLNCPLGSSPTALENVYMAADEVENRFTMECVQVQMGDQLSGNIALEIRDTKDDDDDDRRPYALFSTHAIPRKDTRSHQTPDFAMSTSLVPHLDMMKFSHLPQATILWHGKVSHPIKPKDMWDNPATTLTRLYFYPYQRRSIYLRIGYQSMDWYAKKMPVDVDSMQRESTHPLTVKHGPLYNFQREDRVPQAHLAVHHGDKWDVAFPMETITNCQIYEDRWVLLAVTLDEHESHATLWCNGVRAVAIYIPFAFRANHFVVSQTAEYTKVSDEDIYTQEKDQGMFTRNLYKRLHVRMARLMNRRMSRKELVNDMGYLQDNVGVPAASINVANANRVIADIDPYVPIQVCQGVYSGTRVFPGNRGIVDIPAREWQTFICLANGPQIINSPDITIHNTTVTPVVFLEYADEVQNTTNDASHFLLVVKYQCKEPGSTLIDLTWPDGMFIIRLRKMCVAELINSMTSSIVLETKSTVNAKGQLSSGNIVPEIPALSPIAYSSEIPSMNNSFKFWLGALLMKVLVLMLLLKRFRFKLKRKYRRVLVVLNLALLCWALVFMFPKRSTRRLTPMSRKIPNMPRVSIIMPCYKQSHYVEKAMLSIVHQSYPHWELIMISDASPDSCVEVAMDVQARYRDLDINVINATVNRGLSKSRNIAIEQATGKWICAVDADDFLHEMYLEVMVRASMANPDIRLLYSNQQFFDESDYKWYVDTYNHDRLRWSGMFPVSTLYLRGDWAAIGGYSHAHPWGNEDWHLWTSLSLLHDGNLTVYKDDRFLMYYRWKAFSMMRSMQQFGEVVPLFHTMIPQNYPAGNIINDHRIILDMSEATYLRLKKIHSQDPAEPFVLLWIGMYHEGKKDYEKAMEFYTRSHFLLNASSRPKHLTTRKIFGQPEITGDWQAQWRLAITLAKTGHVEANREECTDILKSHPELLGYQDYCHFLTDSLI